MVTAKLNKAQVTEIKTLLEAFDNVKQALADKLDEIACEWEDAIGERSEKWQESDAGSEANERLETLRGRLEEVPETPDFDLDELI